MDFSALLEVANRNNAVNEKLAQKSKSGFNTHLGPPKRQTPTKPKGVLSDSVKAFLDRKEREEKAKRLAEKRKTDTVVTATKKETQPTKRVKDLTKRSKDNARPVDNKQSGQAQERSARQELEEKRLAFIQKLKESEQKGGRRARSAAASSAAPAGPEVLTDRQRAADAKLMAKYDREIGDEADADVRLDVLTPDKQILDREGYKVREEQRKRELMEKYKGREVPIDMKADKRDKHKHGSKRGEKVSSKHVSKEKDKFKDKHKHKHKHKHKSKESVSSERESKPSMRKTVIKPKFKRPAGPTKPVLSFQDLLNLANQKHSEVLNPMAASKKAEHVPEKKVPRNDRPMTQEEKERLARRQSKEYKDWCRNGGILNISHKESKLDSDSGHEEGRLPAGSTSLNSQHSQHQKPLHDGGSAASREAGRNMGREAGRNMGREAGRDTGREAGRDTGREAGRSTGQEAGRPPPPLHTARPAMNHAPPKGSGGTQSLQARTSKPGTTPPNLATSNNTAGKRAPLAAGHKRDAAGSVKSRETGQQPYSNPFDRIMGQIKKNNPKPESKRRVIESEDELDEEMEDFIEDDDDDFIDDSEQVDYSSIIRSMFRYDPKKFRDENDDDLRSMDVGFSQTLKEEARSARIGKQEDLEDIRREEEERKRKLMLKKKIKSKLKQR